MSESIVHPPATVASALAASLLAIQSQIEWVCEALIPRDSSGGMPSAVAAGVPRHWLPCALQARDDLQPAFFAAMQRLPAQAPARALDTLREKLPPAAFELVARLVCGAYFLDPAVTAALGYPGQQRMHDEPDYDAIMEAAERVMALGPLYVAPR